MFKMLFIILNVATHQAAFVPNPTPYPTFETCVAAIGADYTKLKPTVIGSSDKNVVVSVGCVPVSKGVES